MGVSLKRVPLDDAKLQTFQQNVADAVEELSTQRITAGVLPVTASRKLVGNEDFVLVDASASAAITLVLPSAKLLQRALTVKVTRASTSYAVTIKAVDIPATGSPTIDGAAVVTIPIGDAGSLTIVSDGRNFWTV